MNTGLAEVNLPMDFRLKNIERTQAAKVALSGDGVFHRKDRAKGMRYPSFPLCLLAEVTR